MNGEAIRGLGTMTVTSRKRRIHYVTIHSADSKVQKTGQPIAIIKPENLSEL